MNSQAKPSLARRLGKLATIVVFLIVAVAATVFAVRAYDSLGGPPLAPWHTFVPDELSVAEMDATDWSGYLAAEERIFQSVTDNVTRELPEKYRVSYDRYFSEAPIYPGRFAQDFNRSYVLEPEGKPRGAALLLHGLTDAPYSLRHVAELYRAQGFVAVVMRMPGHGTVPAGLTDAVWEDWMAATRLGVRESVARAGPDAPPSTLSATRTAGRWRSSMRSMHWRTIAWRNRIASSFCRR